MKTGPIPENNGPGATDFLAVFDLNFRFSFQQIGPGPTEEYIGPESGHDGDDGVRPQRQVNLSPFDSRGGCLVYIMILHVTLRENMMNHKLVLGSLVVFLAMFHVVLCSTAVSAPYVQAPYVQAPCSGHRCNPGYGLTQFNGRNSCIKCNPGYNYTRFQGQEKCVK